MRYLKQNKKVLDEVTPLSSKIFSCFNKIKQKNALLEIQTHLIRPESRWHPRVLLQGTSAVIVTLGMSLGVSIRWRKRGAFSQKPIRRVQRWEFPTWRWKFTAGGKQRRRRDGTDAPVVVVRHRVWVGVVPADGSEKIMKINNNNIIDIYVSSY